MNELIGKRCTCTFDMDASEWPIPGFPAWVVVVAVDMPMVKLKSMHSTDEGLWVNASAIKFIRPA